MNVKEVLESARVLECPQKEANILLCAFLDKPKEWIFVHDNDVVQNANEYLKWVKRYLHNEPLEYITGKVSFYSEEFYINEGVLIPRPETELLVDMASEILKDIENPRVLEIGVGSGIISIMLAKLHQKATFVATDINVKALELAYENAKKFDVVDRIEFSLASYDEGVEGNFDLLVSNPPYIKNGTLLERHVLNEPHQALFGGEKGHEMLEDIVNIAKKRLIENLVCEMGYDQRFAMEQILKQNAKEYIFYKDYASHDRGFRAKF